MSGILLPYQRDWVNEDADFSIYVKSRQIGISWAEALWSVRRRLTTKRDHWFVSADEQTAKEFIRHCRLWAEVFNVIVGEEVVDLEDDLTAQSLSFPNGSRILAVSSNPKATRGKAGDITLDEFAFHLQPEEMYKAAHAVRTWGGKMRIISTENGPTTLFHQIVTGTPANDFVLHRTTLADAVADGLAIKVPGKHHEHLPDVEACNTDYVARVKKTCINEGVFLQEYMCQIGDTSTVITEQEYDLCVLPGYTIPSELDPTQKYGPLYIGIDIGRVRDLSVIWVVEEGYDPKASEHMQRCFRTVAMQVIDCMPFQAQFHIFDRFISHPLVSKACIDQGGIGRQLAEDLQAKHGSNRVEAFNFSNVSKAKLVERTKKYVAQQRVSVPADAVTKADILALKRGSTKAGTVTYDGNSGNSHCDRFMALGLALEAADTQIRLKATSNMEKANGGNDGEEEGSK